MRSLGWADFLKVEMSPDHKTLVVSYWVYVTLERRYLTSLMSYNILQTSNTTANTRSTSSESVQITSTWGYVDNLNCARRHTPLVT